MGWFCTEIIAQPSPRIIELLRKTPGVDRSLYFVPAVPGPLSTNFPKSGLVFVRNVGFVLWGDEVAVPWPEPPVGVDVALSIPRDLPKVQTEEVKDVSPTLPESFLRYLKWLSGETQSVVAYYTDFSWGGPSENQLAWIFEPRAPRERVYCGLFGEPRVRVYREGVKPSEEHGTALAMTLWRLGVDAPKWEFAPHRSGFDWSLYRVPGRTNG